ncbi:hypothetical protein ACWGA9_06235 [Streptomyces sp. NPDC054950]
MTYALLLVLTSSIAGVSTGVALYATKENPRMAIYEVTRTDVVAPGEFVSAVVIAPGVDLARKSVAHLPGVSASGAKRNVEARKMDTTGPVSLVTTEFDDSPTLDDALTDAPEYTS